MNVKQEHVSVVLTSMRNNTIYDQVIVYSKTLNIVLCLGSSANLRYAQYHWNTSAADTVSNVSSPIGFNPVAGLFVLVF